MENGGNSLQSRRLDVLAHVPIKRKVKVAFCLETLKTALDLFLVCVGEAVPSL